MLLLVFGRVSAQPSIRGLQVGVAYVGDAFANVHGGGQRGTALLHNVDLMLSLDAERALGWKGAKAFLYGLGNSGADPSALVGDLQGVSNIEAPYTWRLYEAWIEQSLVDGQLSVRGGLYDLNSEFYVAETAALFLNGAHGVGTELSETGINGPSIFPFTSMAFRARFEPVRHTYLQVAVLDAVPGTPNLPHLVSIAFNHEEGALLVGESAYEKIFPSGARTKIAAGGWMYSRLFDEIVGPEAVASEKGRSYGLYGLLERTLYRGAGDRGLDLYCRAGMASSRVNPVALAWGAGLVYTGLIPGRSEDQLGLAITSAHASRRYREMQHQPTLPVDRAETALELTFRAQLTPWMVIQPDVQYIINPGMDRSLKNALALGQRLEISF